MNKPAQGNPDQALELQCRLDGMDCPDCAAKIERRLAGLPGVEAARVDFARARLAARVASPAAAERVREAVRALGYGVTEEGPVSSVLRVRGMDCAEEKALVEKALQGLPGLERLEVNLMSERLTVMHDPARLPVKEILRALAAVGLRAEPFGATAAARPDWRSRARTVSTVVSGVAVAAGLAWHFLGPGDGWERLFFGLAVASGGWFIARKGLAAARHGSLDMNFLMTVAVVGAMFIDAWDEAGMVVFLFALAQVLEGRAMDRARNAVRALMDLAPPVARLVENGTERIVPVAEVAVGARLRVRPGEKIPLDGEIVEGASAVNQAPITGESVPVDKGPGDTVYAGSINGQGTLLVRSTRAAADTTLAHIIHLIEEAQAARAPSQAFVDRFARVYTPAVLVLAVFIALVPPLALGQPFADWFYRALVLLVIACPCALVIATPVAIVSGLARGARAGVLIKGGVHLENTGHLVALAFDKTGTLTEGVPRVQRVEPLPGADAGALLRVAAALETHSEHPLAGAVRDHARERGVEVPPVSDFRALTGMGVEGRVDGTDCLVGNHRLFEERGLCSPALERRLEALEDAGHTVVLVARAGQVLGFIAIADRLRPEAPAAVAALRRLGVAHLVLLTGDNPGTARAIGSRLGLDEIRDRLLPADKVAAVKDLVRRHGRAGMVGDGVNDAPALAAATTGIAMGAAGSDAALETADVVLMGDDLTRLPFAVRLSRATLRVVRANITLALGIKAVFLVLALPGYATLWMAVFADVGATLIVVANSLRLVRLRD